MISGNKQIRTAKKISKGLLDYHTHEAVKNVNKEKIEDSEENLLKNSKGGVLPGGTSAVVFHRTPLKDIADRVLESGFKPGSGDFYGKGFYSNLEEKQVMGSSYGDYVMKCHVLDLVNFIWFDYPEFSKTLFCRELGNPPKEIFIKAQLDWYDIQMKSEHYKSMISQMSWTRNAPGAKFFYDHGYMKKANRRINGLVMRGVNDGLTLVSYFPNEVVVPFAYTKGRGENPWIDVKFTSYRDSLLNIEKDIKFRAVKVRVTSIFDLKDVVKMQVTESGVVNIEGSVNLKGVYFSGEFSDKIGSVTEDFIVANTYIKNTKNFPDYVGGVLDLTNALSNVEQLANLKATTIKIGGQAVYSYKALPSKLDCNLHIKLVPGVSLETHSTAITGDLLVYSRSGLTYQNIKELADYSVGKTLRVNIDLINFAQKLKFPAKSDSVFEIPKLVANKIEISFTEYRIRENILQEIKEAFLKTNPNCTFIEN